MSKVIRYCRDCHVPLLRCSWLQERCNLCMTHGKRDTLNSYYTETCSNCLGTKSRCMLIPYCRNCIDYWTVTMSEVCIGCLERISDTNEVLCKQCWNDIISCKPPTPTLNEAQS